MTICDTIANDHYDTRSDMAMAFAALLNEEAKELEALGAGAELARKKLN
jgi:5-methyltetrahydropteroyltriglutamate--homocysteine methyltransferase